MNKLSMKWIHILVNHSCDANAEIQYQHNNSTLSVVATRMISNDEVYLEKELIT